MKENNREIKRTNNNEQVGTWSEQRHKIEMGAKWVEFQCRSLMRLQARRGLRLR